MRAGRVRVIRVLHCSVGKDGRDNTEKNNGYL